MRDIDWSRAPKGATHYRPKFHSPWYKIHDNGKWFFWTGFIWASSGERYLNLDNMIARQSPAWSGEGLPPVGVICEVDYCEQWQRCEVIAHFQQRCGMVAAFTVEFGDGAKSLDAFGAESFRPIRTPEQIAADEREAVIEHMLRTYLDGAKDHRGGIRALYDAGYRKP